MQATPIEKDFPVIVSADDVAIGKPDPAIYEMAFKLVNSVQPRPASIKSEERLVIEDSKAGIRSAQAAGMKVAALGACPTLVAAASYAAKYGAMRWRSYRMLWHINRVYVMSDRLLATTYPTEQLKHGNLVLTTLEGVSLERLQAFPQQ